MRFDVSFVKKLNFGQSNMKLFGAIFGFALLAGVGTGYFLSSSAKAPGQPILLNQPPKNFSQDTRVCKDFATGKVTKKPAPKSGETYIEGTHLLVRDGAAPVALTSSGIDLSQYENKKVKVTGETQKALKEGWLMDVCRVEEQ